MKESKLRKIAEQIAYLEQSNNQNEDKIMEIITNNKLNLLDMIKLNVYIQDILDKK